MSGRLVISRHKSWHVWNQDNQEKVLRDERLAKESEDAKKHHEKRRAQEKNLELLLGRTSQPDEPESLSQSLRGERNISNPVKEFQKKEEIPEKLGELATNKPWYLKPHHQSTKKEEDKPEEDDPMKSFLTIPSQNNSGSIVLRKGVPSFASINFAELREKRLKREKQERKRAIDLLANHDIYGNSRVKRKKED